MKKQLQKTVGFLYSDNKGQAMSEYALILALIAIVAIAAIGLFGEQIVDLFTAASDEVGDAVDSTE